MIVLIISHAAGTPDIGPNMRTFYLARNLVQRGNEVHIVGAGNFHKYHHSPLESVTKATSKMVEGIHYTWLPAKAYTKRNHQQVINQLHFAYLLWRDRKKYADLKPDVVLMSSPPPFGVYGAAAIAKKAKAKLLFEIRDLWPEIIQELGNFGPNHPFLKMISHAVKKAYKSADGIISVKPGDLTYIADKYKPKAALQYIPNGFDHNFVLDEEYSHEVFDTNTFKIVYTGALSNYYALEFLLQAAQRLKSGFPNIQFVIVGDGDDRATYEQMKKDLNLTNVTFLGHLAKKYMLSVIRQSDVGFLGLKDTKANRFGISTNKIYEYMYAQKPIIASYNTDHDVVANSGGGISVKPESAAEIEKAIVELYNLSESERQAMADRGYAYLMHHHTFEQISIKYLEFIESIEK